MKTRREIKPKATIEHRKFHIPSFPLVAETSVARFPPGKENLLGLKYRLPLYALETLGLVASEGKQKERHRKALRTDFERIEVHVEL